MGRERTLSHRLGTQALLDLHHHAEQTLPEDWIASGVPGGQGLEGKWRKGHKITGSHHIHETSSEWKNTQQLNCRAGRGSQFSWDSQQRLFMGVQAFIILITLSPSPCVGVYTWSQCPLHSKSAKGYQEADGT